MRRVVLVGSGVRGRVGRWRCVLRVGAILGRHRGRHVHVPRVVRVQRAGRVVLVDGRHRRLFLLVGLLLGLGGARAAFLACCWLGVGLRSTGFELSLGLVRRIVCRRLLRGLVALRDGVLDFLLVVTHADRKGREMDG